MNYTLEYLNTLNLHSLRTYAREIGVKAPTSLVKKQLINEILLIQSGKKQPHISSKKGRPTSNVIEKNFFETLEKINLKEQEKKQIIKLVLIKLEQVLNEIL